MARQGSRNSLYDEILAKVGHYLFWSRVGVGTPINGLINWYKTVFVGFTPISGVMGPLPLTSAMVVLAPMLNCQAPSEETSVKLHRKADWDLWKTLPSEIPWFAVPSFLRQIPDFFHDLIPRFDAILFQVGDLSSKAHHLFRIYWIFHRGWFSQSSLMFSKASQSSLGMPSYALPLNTPPLRTLQIYVVFFLG